MTIFTAGGLILYQYTAQPSLFANQTEDGVTDGPALTRQIINTELLEKILAAGRHGTKTYHIVDGKTLVWAKSSLLVSRADDNKKQQSQSQQQQPQSYYLVALYPDIMFEGPRQYLKTWAEGLVGDTAREYQLYYESCCRRSHSAADSDPGSTRVVLRRPDPKPFDQTFRALLQKLKTEKRPTDATTSSSSAIHHTSTSSTSTSTTANNGSKKQMRSWGNAKVTEKSMAALDMSDETNSPEAVATAHERALAEAREAYLPSANEINEGDELTLPLPSAESASNTNSWGSTVTGLFQQLTGQKVLTSADLDAPVQQMETLLKEKNVAQPIAHDLCESVRQQLIGKRLNSLFRVQTAVQQALESRLTQLLRTSDVDLLRHVLQRRGESSSLFSKLSSSSSKRPYVIAVMGINGIGKTTSLAKLAYYFEQHGCRPLLVAGDTFRSGAVEQLRVHADCLGVDLFTQGYAKDPSAVTAAAIQHASANGHDVVLVDTAGRMQNNVPLMKALGKLVTENRPDFLILVAEALVGHDGVSQHELFARAAGRPVDGLLLTKFDTVDGKLGAALTLTHETGCPIVFVGVGQKYHHLKKLPVATVVQSLLA